MANVCAVFGLSDICPSAKANCWVNPNPVVRSLKEWTAKIWRKSEARCLPEEMREGGLGRSEQHTRYNADNNEEKQNRNRHAVAGQERDISIITKVNTQFPTPRE